MLPKFIREIPNVIETRVAYVLTDHCLLTTKNKEKVHLPSITKIVQYMSEAITIPVNEYSLLWILLPSVRNQLRKHRVRMLIDKGTGYLKVPPADVKLDSVAGHYTSRRQDKDKSRNNCTINGSWYFSSDAVT